MNIHGHLRALCETLGEHTTGANIDLVYRVRFAVVDLQRAVATLTRSRNRWRARARRAER